MRLNSLDLATMVRLMGDLTAAHGKPFGAVAERQAAVYHAALKDCTSDEVEMAVRQACKVLDRFPKPSHLRTLIFAGRGKRPEMAPDLDRCSTCNTRYQWRRIPHWVQGSHSLECDCAWRMIVHCYASDDDLAGMGENDPFARDETRRRARKVAA